MSNIAETRLKNERRNWRRKHPPGFFARPQSKADGATNLFAWECGIPGKPDTPWEGGLYKISVEFSEDYPSEPPLCKFTPTIFHPNVYASGRVCLSLLSSEKDWRPNVTLHQILVGIQDLLTSPNERDPAQGYANNLYMNNRSMYEERVREEAKQHNPQNRS